MNPRVIVRKNGKTFFDIDILTLIDLYLFRTGTYVVRPYDIEVKITDGITKVTAEDLPE